MRYYLHSMYITNKEGADKYRNCHPVNFLSLIESIKGEYVLPNRPGSLFSLVKS